MGEEKDWHAAQSLGASGRRGHAGNRAAGRAIAEDHSTPKFPSDNHLNEGASCAAINGLGYANARMALDHAIGLDVPELEHAAPGGITEDGPLYGGAGHLQPIVEIGICARLDGEQEIRDRCRAVARSFVGHAVTSCVWKIPTQVDGWIGSQLVPGGTPHVKGKLWLCGMDGPRAVFNAGWGWNLEGQKNIILQNLLDAPGRVLPSRYAGYQVGDDNWDGHWSNLAMLSGLVRATPSPAELSSAFANGRLDPADFGLTEEDCEDLRAFVQSEGIDNAMWVRELSAGIAYRFSRDVVRLFDGRVITVASKSTSGPKPPVVWTEYGLVIGCRQRYCCPNEYQGAQAGDGRGWLERGGDGKWRAVGVSENDGNRHESDPWRDEDVLSHWHYEEKTTNGYQLGELDPNFEDGTPSPPPDPGDDEMYVLGLKLYAKLQKIVQEKLDHGMSPEDIRGDSECRSAYSDWAVKVGLPSLVDE